MIAGEPNEGGSLHLNKLKCPAFNTIDYQAAYIFNLQT